MAFGQLVTHPLSKCDVILSGAKDLLLHCNRA
jgi:hypothetical protein